MSSSIRWNPSDLIVSLCTPTFSQVTYLTILIFFFFWGGLCISSKLFSFIRNVESLFTLCKRAIDYLKLFCVWWILKQLTGCISCSNCCLYKINQSVQWVQLNYLLVGSGILKPFEKLNLGNAVFLKDSLLNNKIFTACNIVFIFLTQNWTELKSSCFLTFWWNNVTIVRMLEVSETNLEVIKLQYFKIF